MSKLRIKAAGALRKLADKIAATVKGDKKPFSRVASEITKYIYLNPGLNRTERNNLYAKIKRKGIHRNISNGDRDAAIAILKASPKNVPATQARLIENSRLRRAGEAIKVWTRS